MTITVNGERCQVAEELTIRQLVEKQNVSPRKVAVELNRRLVRDKGYDTVLSDGDEVEIVTLVGGG